MRRLDVTESIEPANVGRLARLLKASERDGWEPPTRPTWRHVVGVPCDMRIVGWNTRQGGGHTKYEHLGELSPDVAVLPEYGDLPCGPPPGVTDGRFLDFGTAGERGIGVVAAPAWTISAADVLPISGEVVGAVEVCGDLEVNVIAVWACLSGRPAVNPVVEAATAWADWVHTRPTVVIGDFNTGFHWTDAKGSGAHSPIVEALAALGLRQVCCSSTDHDGPTTHWHGGTKKSFHIDHVFVSSDLAVASWGVGLHHPWASLSDHAPIVVDVAPR